MKITREELYEAVWREPITRLAPSYGISQVALAKLCRDLQVPAPPVGHWSKLAHGKASPRPPLGAARPDSGEKPSQAPKRPSPRPATPLAATAATSQSSGNDPRASASTTPVDRIDPAPARLTNPHPAVKATLDALAGESPGDNGMVQPRRHPALPGDAVPLEMRVSPALKRRALGLADALIKRLLHLGHAFDPGSHRDPSSPDQRPKVPALLIAGERVPFVVEEKPDRRPHVPTDRERAKMRSHWMKTPTWDYYPSGKLSVRVGGGVYLADRLRKQWSDGRTGTLEQSLEEVGAGLVEVGLALRRRTDERARWEAEWKEQARLRAELERLEANEQARRDELEARAESWRKAATLRSFVAEMRKRLEAGREEALDGADAWIAWASAHADSLDPLADGIANLIRNVDAAGAGATGSS